MAVHQKPASNLESLGVVTSTASTWDEITPKIPSTAPFLSRLKWLVLIIPMIHWLIDWLMTVCNFRAVCTLQLRHIKNLLLTHSGPFCPRHGTISLQWSQHDRVPHPQHGKLSGVVDHREVVNGAATSPTQTWLRPVGWIHDGRHKPFSCCSRTFYAVFAKTYAQMYSICVRPNGQIHQRVYVM